MDRGELRHSNNGHNETVQSPPRHAFGFLLQIVSSLLLSSLCHKHVVFHINNCQRVSDLPSKSVGYQSQRQDGSHGASRPRHSQYQEGLWKCETFGCTIDGSWIAAMRKSRLPNSLSHCRRCPRGDFHHDQMHSNGVTFLPSPVEEFCGTHESIRETVNFACDQRRVLHHLVDEFHPRIDFSHVDSHHDELWRNYDDRLGQDYSGHRESAQLYKVAERGREFLTWLQGREETEVVVCSHEAFLRCILNWGQEGGVPFMPEQHLDDRISGKESSVNIPLFRYHGNGEFEAYMRRSYDNCELRSFLLSFSSDIP